MKRPSPRDAPASLRSRAAAIELLVLDCDGVLTDGRIGFGPEGDTWRAFHVRDGAAIKIAQRAGIRVGILSGRRVEAVRLRALELDLDLVRQGHRIKEPVWDELLRELGLHDAQAAYMGDDWLDVPVLRRAGIAACPADGAVEAREAAHVVTEANGGHGAVCELIRWLVDARGSWADETERALRDD